jgi:hypothetical protein
MTRKPVVYSEPKLIIGEGKADQIFFSELFKAHNLSGFQSDFPVLGDDLRGGWSKLGTYLKGLGVSPTFAANVRKVVLVADNDEASSFENIRGEVTKAGYSVPDAPKQFVSTAGKPEVAILMIPDTFPGCLETLCYAAASNRWSTLIDPLATYFAVTPAANWSSTKQAKMKVQCLLASTCEKNPGVALHDHWLKDAQYHIPVTDPAFQDAVAFLNSM